MSTTVTILIAAAFPTITALIGIILGRSDINNLRSDIRSDINNLRTDIRADIRILNEIAYEHHGRLTKLEKE